MANPVLRVDAVRLHGRTKLADAQRFARALRDEVAARLQAGVRGGLAKRPARVHLDQIRIRCAADAAPDACALAAHVADAIFNRVRH